MSFQRGNTGFLRFGSYNFLVRDLEHREQVSRILQTRKFVKTKLYILRKHKGVNLTQKENIAAAGYAQGETSMPDFSTVKVVRWNGKDHYPITEQIYPSGTIVYNFELQLPNQSTPLPTNQDEGATVTTATSV